MPPSDDAVRAGSRASRRALRRALTVLCPTCAHPWGEHAGTPYEIADPTVCGECVYELEHGFTQLPACDLRVPEAIAGG
ncbi:hypothetical protein [Oerskovia jenensis]|uniref:hypothetical protein n=1 Tax=Oerskovia jenensis TaxID=162169 RepID=UPI0036DA4C08